MIVTTDYRRIQQRSGSGLLSIPKRCLGTFLLLSILMRQSLKVAAQEATNGGDEELPLTIFGKYQVLDQVDHDETAFSQGLELDPNNPNFYYESTGLYGSSSVRLVSLKDNIIIHQTDVADEFFGEGLTLYNNRILQLTWKSGIGFIYDASQVTAIGTFPINTTSGEGWGICYRRKDNDDILYVSDGTNYIHTWDADTQELLSEIQVRARFENDEILQPLTGEINELEWDPYTETILANIWKKDYILRIDPTTGFVTHQYDLAALQRPADADVLNGIAMTNVPDEIWVTGKLWPTMYRIRLSDGNTSSGSGHLLRFWYITILGVSQFLLMW